MRVCGHVCMCKCVRVHVRVCVCARKQVCVMPYLGLAVYIFLLLTVILGGIGQ